MVPLANTEIESGLEVDARRGWHGVVALASLADQASTCAMVS